MVNIKILKSIIIGALLMQFQAAATHYSVMETKGNDAKISLKVISFLSGDEKELNLQASPQGTVLDVKNMIQKRTKMAPKFQKLTFKNKELEDKRILSYYIKHKRAELCVAERTKGLGDTFSFTSIKGKATVEIKEDFKNQPAANQGLDFEAGLNLVGICKNANCIASKNLYTVLPKGYSKRFRIGREIYKAKCPCCQQKLTEITTFMFSYCKYTITGESEQSGEFEHSGTHTDINAYETFLPSKHEVDLETVIWMEVSVEELD